MFCADIMDGDLKALRNARWESAFKESQRDLTEAGQVAVNRKATIVIEHLIQASDVAHTMQVGIFGCDFHSLLLVSLLTL